MMRVKKIYKIVFGLLACLPFLVFAFYGISSVGEGFAAEEMMTQFQIVADDFSFGITDGVRSFLYDVADSFSETPNNYGVMIQSVLSVVSYELFLVFAYLLFAVAIFVPLKCISLMEGWVDRK